ncbi:hypothetical protein I5U90_06525 [Stenotrophomonas maltophilia]|uniref:hypothetical protein n=1 Tax=Stenotrophomonas maltophilia TaxID=40324 RepID=UPI0018D3C39A|nr:hypothetical protein [Stenotrophomonas maltophilia]MBH1672690.1 hypothetical protein [Stenotrophomonas maltophilia]MBH1856252.1 hypothetical protein [Stenotrophomonas maltophilia]MCU0991441.1 hypothetical protein [Stenotrophomonas maltophilia]MCU1134042.1 hypothetical protein [Stenotrophomonas maltophilia]
MSGISEANFAGDLPGDPVDSYDFSRLGLGRKATQALLLAFTGVTSTYRVQSRKQAWGSLRKFAKFLSELDGDPWRNMRSSTISQRYVEWLKAGLLLKTGGSHFNLLGQIYAWLGANDTENSVVWMNVHFPRGQFKREEECPRENILSEEQMRSILVASKKGIDEVRARTRVMAALADGGDVQCISARDRVALDGMRQGMARGVLGKLDLCEAGYTPYSVKYRTLKRYLFLGISDYIPYLLYMIIETGGNPGGLMALCIDCISDHAVDPLKKEITWDKFRSTRQSSASVCTEGAYAIPTLIKEVVEFTSVLRNVAGARADTVFLSLCRGSIGRVSIQSWHNELALFIERHGLMDFNFVDLRLSGARLLGNRGERIERVQSELQHRHSRTTALYIRSPERKGLAHAKLLGFMGKVVQSAQAVTSNRGLYKTTQGYDCTDATSGDAPASRRGQKCTDFLHCAFCPNSVAVLDSPRHVARMIAAKRELDDMKKLAASSSDVSSRYKYAYEASHEILAALLGRITKDVLRKAEKLSVSVPMLGLE